MPTTIDTPVTEIEPEAVHGWFELTYANYLALPRTLLQSMPDEWQTRFVRCLEELDAAFAHIEHPDTYEVKAAKTWEVGDLPAYLRKELGITLVDASDDDEDTDVPDLYYDRDGNELTYHDTVLVPVPDPVPHYNRGRTRIEPRITQR